MGFEDDAKPPKSPQRVLILVGGPATLREIAHRLMGKWACEYDHDDGDHSLICDEITVNLTKEVFR